MRVKKIGTVFFATIIMGLICIAALFGGVQVAHAESPVSGTDGRYNVSYTIGGQTGIGADMIARYMDGTVVVEKIGDNYYASVTQLSSSMEDLSLNLAEGMQVGYRITEDNGSRKTYSYTLSAENLASALPFSVFVAPRGETFTFTITLDLANATRVGDVEDTTTDRPGEFVPQSEAVNYSYITAENTPLRIVAEIRRTYSVVFSIDRTYSSSFYQPMTVYEGEYVTLPWAVTLNDPENYRLVGWNVMIDGEYVMDGEEYLLIEDVSEYAINGNVTFVAVFGTIGD